MAKLLKPLAHKDLSLIARKIIAAVLLLSASCAPKDVEPEKKHSWVISQDSMALLLTDVHLVEGAKIGDQAIGDTLPIAVHYQKIWDKYGINQSRYDSNFLYYSRNAHLMDEIYAKVLENLSKIEANTKNLPGEVDDLPMPELEKRP